MLDLKSVAAKLKNSLGVKIIIIGFIVLLLLIPYFMSVELRHDREQRSRNAVREVSGKWGREQLVTAPVLALPIYRLQTKTDKKTSDTFVADTLHVLPEHVSIDCSLTPEIRYRGIYQVMLYRSVIKIKADFLRNDTDLPENCKFAANAGSILIRVSDVKGFENLTAEVNGHAVSPLPGGIISVPLSLEESRAGKLAFAAELKLKGCRNLLLSPIGRTFKLSMESTWRHPGFTGGFLPRSRTINDTGFKAEWLINEINSAFPRTWVGSLDKKIPDCAGEQQVWRYRSNDSGALARTVGVSLVQVAGTYQRVERVSNYAFLVIAIVLAAFLIGETVTKIWIHPIQYFFAGLTLVTFYVLLLALAEHLPFNWSYLLATVIISGMTTLYCRMIFAERQSAALLMGGIMLLAYALVFALVRLEDYALLAGSGILLVLLAILMRVTGNMNKEKMENQ